MIDLGLSTQLQEGFDVRYRGESYCFIAVSNIISSKINREINAIDKKASSAIDHLRERLTMKAVQDQQFIMTSANNLAVLLSQILRDMQEEMANNMPSSQQCEKPGKGSPKPGDLKKMQEQFTQQIEQTRIKQTHHAAKPTSPKN